MLPNRNPENDPKFARFLLKIAKFLSPLSATLRPCASPTRPPTPAESPPQELRHWEAPPEGAARAGGAPGRRWRGVTKAGGLRVCETGGGRMGVEKWYFSERDLCESVGPLYTHPATSHCPTNTATRFFTTDLSGGNFLDFFDCCPVGRAMGAFLTRKLQ